MADRWFVGQVVKDTQYIIKSLETRHCIDDYSSALSMLLFSLKFGADPLDKNAPKCITVTFEYFVWAYNILPFDCRTAQEPYKKIVVSVARRILMQTFMLY